MSVFSFIIILYTGVSIFSPKNDTREPSLGYNQNNPATSRHCFGPPIGGFSPIFHEFPTPLRSVQICSDNGSIYEGVKILWNQPKMASFSPEKSLWEQSLYFRKPNLMDLDHRFFVNLDSPEHGQWNFQWKWISVKKTQNLSLLQKLATRPWISMTLCSSVATLSWLYQWDGSRASFLLLWRWRHVTKILIKISWWGYFILSIISNLDVLL